MRTGKTTALGCCLLAAILASSPALAVLTTDVILILGVEVDTTHKPLDHKAVKAAGLESFFTPSITWDCDQRKQRTFMGKRLGMLGMMRKSPEHVSMPVPTADQIRQVKKSLEKLGIHKTPELILVVFRSGGK
jgi:hypothetical protein